VKRVVRARAGVVATGADVRLLDRLGLVERRRASGIAARCYVRSSLQIADLVFSFENSTLPGYRWVFPLGNGTFNVGCVSFATNGYGATGNLKQMFERFTTGFPLARELLRGGEFVSPLRGARIRCGLTGVSMATRGPVLAIGETIGSTFPVSGEGVGNAMESAELAADVINEACDGRGTCDLQAYAPTIKKAMQQRFRNYQFVERWIRTPWLNELVLGRLAKSQSLQHAFHRVIDDQVDPRTVFSCSAVLQSFWK
jgi:flavin-dependent dehydrogenase